MISAKQVGGYPFGIAVLEAAREYPFQNPDSTNDSLTLGIDKAGFDPDHPDLFRPFLLAEASDRFPRSEPHHRSPVVQLLPFGQLAGKARSSGAKTPESVS